MHFAQEPDALESGEAHQDVGVVGAHAVVLICGEDPCGASLQGMAVSERPPIPWTRLLATLRNIAYSLKRNSHRMAPHEQVLRRAIGEIGLKVSDQLNGLACVQHLPGNQQECFDRGHGYFDSKYPILLSVGAFVPHVTGIDAKNGALSDIEHSLTGSNGARIAHDVKSTHTSNFDSLSTGEYMRCASIFKQIGANRKRCKSLFDLPMLTRTARSGFRFEPVPAFLPLFDKSIASPGQCGLLAGLSIHPSKHDPDSSG